MLTSSWQFPTSGISFGAVLGALLGLPAGAQEDCFNDDHRAARNDFEPPATPLPALTVSDADIARMLAAIADGERRRADVAARRDEVKP